MRTMTVKELIVELEEIENKELDVVMDSGDYILLDVEPIETNRYYYKDGTAKRRDCVVLIGWQ